MDASMYYQITKKGHWFIYNDINNQRHASSFILYSGVIMNMVKFESEPGSPQPEISYFTFEYCFDHSNNDKYSQIMVKTILSCKTFFKVKTWENNFKYIKEKHKYVFMHSLANVWKMNVWAEECEYYVLWLQE